MQEALREEQNRAKELKKSLMALQERPEFQVWMELLAKNRKTHEQKALYGDVTPVLREEARCKCEGILLAEHLVDYTVKWAEDVLAIPIEDRDDGQ